MIIQTGISSSSSSLRIRPTNSFGRGFWLPIGSLETPFRLELKAVLLLRPHLAARYLLHLGYRPSGFFQRENAAFLAISERRRLLRTTALALPPFNPPSRPSSTASRS